jgi:hypothetical protein
MGNLSDNLKSMAYDCNAIQALSDACADTVKDCIIDLSQKIQSDNCGTTNPKDNQLSDLMESSEVLSDIPDLFDNLFEIFNK